MSGLNRLLDAYVCPLQSSKERWGMCVNDNCAWYDQERGQCAVLSFLEECRGENRKDGK